MTWEMAKKEDHVLRIWSKSWYCHDLALKWSFTYSIRTSVSFVLLIGINMDCLLEFIAFCIVVVGMLGESSPIYAQPLLQLKYYAHCEGKLYTRTYPGLLLPKCSCKNVIMKFTNRSIGLLVAWGPTLVGHAATKSLFMDVGPTTQHGGSLPFHIM